MSSHDDDMPGHDWDLPTDFVPRLLESVRERDNDAVGCPDCRKRHELTVQKLLDANMSTTETMEYLIRTAVGSARFANTCIKKIGELEMAVAQLKVQVGAMTDEDGIGLSMQTFAIASKDGMVSEQDLAELPEEVRNKLRAQFEAQGMMRPEKGKQN